MAAYITVGATTTHGGEVITGSPHTTHNGVQVSRKGDKVVCKKCKKLTTILTGDPTFIVDGAPIARGGDVTSCGATLIAIQHSFVESDFEVMGVEQPAPMFEQPAPLVFPKSDPEAVFASFTAPDESSETVISDDDLLIWVEVSTKQALEDGGLWAGPNTGKSKLDTTKFYLGGDKDLQKAFDEIISTSHGQYIVSVIQNDDRILGVTLGKGNGVFGQTIPKMTSEIINEPEWWAIWKQTERVDKVIMDVEINMQDEDPYFVRADRADGKGVYKPNLTEVLAHELGHIKNYSTHGKLFYNHLSIVHQNTIMRQLYKNSIVRHPNAEHGGSFGN
ncbi:MULTISPECIES: PAAR domain-containing protein [unclassified Psychrobacter]|uniref:PAAR domain-containing protein n=1 Tax=unclassified Psychrobacter TaxID=196806 RepID=UPI003FD35711